MEVLGEQYGEAILSKAWDLTLPVRPAAASLPATIAAPREPQVGRLIVLRSTDEGVVVVNVGETGWVRVKSHTAYEGTFPADSLAPPDDAIRTACAAHFMVLHGEMLPSHGPTATAMLPSVSVVPSTLVGAAHRLAVLIVWNPVDKQWGFPSATLPSCKSPWEVLDAPALSPTGIDLDRREYITKVLPGQGEWPWVALGSESGNRPHYIALVKPPHEGQPDNGIRQVGLIDSTQNDEEEVVRWRSGHRHCAWIRVLAVGRPKEIFKSKTSWTTSAQQRTLKVLLGFLNDEGRMGQLQLKDSTPHPRRDKACTRCQLEYYELRTACPRGRQPAPVEGSEDQPMDANALVEMGKGPGAFFVPEGEVPPGSPADWDHGLPPSHFFHCLPQVPAGQGYSTRLRALPVGPAYLTRGVSWVQWDQMEFVQPRYYPRVSGRLVIVVSNGLDGTRAERQWYDETIHGVPAKCGITAETEQGVLDSLVLAEGPWRRFWSSWDDKKLRLPAYDPLVWWNSHFHVGSDPKCDCYVELDLSDRFAYRVRARAYSCTPEYVGSQVGNTSIDPNLFQQGRAPPTPGGRCWFYRPDYSGNRDGRHLPARASDFGNRDSASPPGSKWLYMFNTFPKPVALARMRAPLLLPDDSHAVSFFSQQLEPSMFRIHGQHRSLHLYPGAFVPETRRPLDGSGSFTRPFVRENQAIALSAFKSISYFLVYSHGAVAILSGMTRQEDAWAYTTTGAAWIWVGVIDHLVNLLRWTVATRNRVLPVPDERVDWPDLRDDAVVRGYILHVCAFAST